jgi:hypothetical protein
MAEDHFPSSTAYRVVQHKNFTYGVEVKKPSRTAYTVNLFHSEREARNWINHQRQKTKASKPD